MSSVTSFKGAALGGGIVIILAVVFFFVSLALFLESPQPLSDQEVDFVIAKGEGFKEIAVALERQDLIKSAGWFKLYALATGKAQQFKPGLYHLAPSQSGQEIADQLIQGPEDILVVVKEGETLVDIDRQLAEAGVIKSGELIEYDRLRQQQQGRALEGYLFPDSYRLEPGAEVARVVKKFLENFENKAGEIAYEDLILASLIEKEAAHPQDRLLAAGILKKRLQLGMPLQVDAANVYIKCQGAYLTCSDELRQLSRTDLKIDSLYNTYLHRGLPPTPIANPGKEAIVASLNPQSSEYLYYISNPKTGRLIFSIDLDEHNGNRFKYLR